MIRVLALLALAGPVAAEGAFSLPAGCAGYVTVQKRGCVVTHLFTCQGDPAGHQRRVDMVEDGMSYLGIIDTEAQWIESNHLSSGIIDTLVPGATDPASFSELLAAGRDSWDFEMQASDGLRIRNTGTDQIIGDPVMIDGVELFRTRFSITATDAVTGVTLWSSTGEEYIHPEWRTFLSGIRQVTAPGESYEADNSPVSFAFPGEPGFLAAAPRHDCSAAISALTPPTIPVLAKEF